MAWAMALISKNSPIPLFTIIKTCQILNLNYSEVLKGSILRAKNNPNNSFVIPLKFKPEILRILTWIKTDGHIKLGSTHIEISQMENKQALVELNEIIKQTFRIKHKETWFVKSRGEDSLIYSSAALRQFLVLFYHIPPGYKTGSTSKLNFIQLSRKDQLKILSAYVETEGCLSYNTTRGKKRKLPKFEISTKTENLTEECFQLLVNLGYTPKKYYKHNLFKAGLYNSKQVIHLINELKPHLLSSKKTDYLKQICSNGIGL